MKIQNILIIALVSLAIFACNSPKDQDKELSEQEISQNKITEFEKALHNEIEPDADKAIEVINLYTEYWEKYPQDTICAEYLFRASEVAMNFEQPHNSIRFLTTIETDYLEFDKYPTVLFMKGFVYENYIGDYEKAIKAYEVYINKYPNHTFVKDAESAIMFMGMNDDQLMELFQDMNRYN